MDAVDSIDAAHSDRAFLGVRSDHNGYGLSDQLLIDFGIAVLDPMGKELVGCLAVLREILDNETLDELSLLFFGRFLGRITRTLMTLRE